MYNKLILNIKPMGFRWETRDPFLFCVHHLDRYPEGNGQMGPAASLRGRNLGQDFTLKDGWRMYHGEEIPGFPAHPHRGFETVTVVLEGFVDHSDSHGAGGRYGNGDVQWMTAGAGLQHAEMFPLIHEDKPNPLELFQIWLNLPRSRKFAEPHYKMLWAEDIPTITLTDDNGKLTDIRLIAGSLQGVHPPAPAPDSWAADPENEVAVWLIHMEPGARGNLPASKAEVTRTLYLYRGNGVTISGVSVDNYHSVELLSMESAIVQNNSEDAYLLLLQGKPINEPVAQYGPFVMNTQAEIHQAIEDYNRTHFGGWPWDRHDHVHDADRRRFAIYADGKSEKRD